MKFRDASKVRRIICSKTAEKFLIKGVLESKLETYRITEDFIKHV